MDDVLQTAQRLFGLVNAAWTTRALAVAAELGISEILADGPRSVQELACATGCDAHAVHRLLRALTSVDAYEELDDGRFALLPVDALLAERAPQSLHAWALHFGRQMWPAWQELDQSVRTGKSPARAR